MTIDRMRRPRRPDRTNRQCANQSGEGKHGFKTKGEALAYRRKMRDSHVNVYRCPVCKLWHHGRRNTRP